MGLEQFNIAPDNKGGRKKKEETDEKGYSRRPTPGYECEPLTRDNDGEEYWQKVWDKFVEGDSASNEELAKMTEYTACLPRDIKLKLDTHGIWSSDDVDDLRWEKPDKTSSVLSKLGGSSSSSDSDDDDAPSSGLASLVNDAS